MFLATFLHSSLSLFFSVLPPHLPAPSHLRQVPSLVLKGLSSILIVSVSLEFPFGIASSLGDCSNCWRCGGSMMCLLGQGWVALSWGSSIYGPLTQATVSPERGSHGHCFLCPQAWASVARYSPQSESQTPTNMAVGWPGEAAGCCDQV